MSLSSFLRALTGRESTRTFRNVSGQPGSTALRRPGALPTVVAIHGFTGTPGEVEVVCDVATELGLGSVAPLLAGHGHDARALSRTAYSDWLESARPTFDEARRKGPVILVGLSMGSLVATELCLSAPGDVAGLALLSNAFWLAAPHPRFSLRAAAALHFPDFYIDKGSPSVSDSGGLKGHLSLDAQPFRSAVSLEAAGRRLREELFRIHRPTLIVHGAHDDVCPVQNAWRVAERLGTNESRVVILPHSRHVITRDQDRHKLASELRTFLDTTASQARASDPRMASK